MERLFVTLYRYRDGLDADDLRELTKKFVEVGTAPGVIAHYTRLDNQGGFLVTKDTAELAATFKVNIEYAPWVEFEIIPVATMEEAFPVIQEVYG